MPAGGEVYIYSDMIVPTQFASLQKSPLIHVLSFFQVLFSTHIHPPCLYFIPTHTVDHVVAINIPVNIPASPATLTWPLAASTETQGWSHPHFHCGRLRSESSRSRVPRLADALASPSLPPWSTCRIGGGRVELIYNAYTIISLYPRWGYVADLRNPSCNDTSQ